MKKNLKFSGTVSSKVQFKINTSIIFNYWAMHLTQVGTTYSIWLMEDFPRTIMEFEKKFATEDACREYLFKIRWPDGFKCPSCQGKKAWLTSNKLYHCANCSHQTAVTAGTIFQDTSFYTTICSGYLSHVRSPI